jgi:hypothetical protein
MAFFVRKPPQGIAFFQKQKAAASFASAM